MPYLSSRQQNHTEPHFRRSTKNNGPALTAVLVLLCCAGLFYCGMTLFGMTTGS